MERGERRWARTTWIAVSGMLVSAVAAWAASHVEAGAKAAPDAKVARGEYLVTVMGCGDCHTPGSFYGAPDLTRRLAGSELGWQGPWGVSFPRNITPDVETGIGSWTEAQIVDAIRNGRRPDGRTLLPPMPWPDFVGLTDEDATAIAAYLKSIPAVHHVMPALVPPGQPFKGSALVFPPPPAWDAPKAPPAAGPSAAPAAPPAK